MLRHRVVALQLNLKQAQAVKFLTTLEEATGYDESLSTMYRLIQDSDSKLANMLADKKTVATVFAPVDDVSIRSLGGACVCHRMENLHSSACELLKGLSRHSGAEDAVVQQHCTSALAAAAAVTAVSKLWCFAGAACAVATLLMLFAFFSFHHRPGTPLTRCLHTTRAMLQQ